MLNRVKLGYKTVETCLQLSQKPRMRGTDNCNWKNKIILSRINGRSSAYIEWTLLTIYKNRPSEWVLKLSLKRQLYFSHGPVEGSDFRFQINGHIGIRPQWAPVTSWHTTKQHKDGIQFNQDRGGNSQDSQQQHKPNKVNRNDKFDGGDDNSS